MRIKITDEMRKELSALAAKGKLTPREVKAFASRRKTSAIRQWLEAQGAYDPDKSMDRWCLELSRQLIVRVKIAQVDGAGKIHRHRAFVSLNDDRQAGRGYRAFVDVMSDDDLIVKLEATFAKELDHLQRRYDRLLSLEKYREVFDAMRRVADSKEAA